MKRFFATAAAVLFLAMPILSQESHEYAPIEEKAIKYKDWTLKNLKADASPVNLREWTKDKKLVLVMYYAPWCNNWKYQAPVAARLHDKYKGNGFDIIAVNEYGTCDEAKQFFGTGGAPYTVVVESENRQEMAKTTHAMYRRSTGDFRTYGSPYNVFLDPAKLNREGEVLTEKTWVVNGELVEAEAEKFIRERLGIAEADPAKKPVEKPASN